MPSLVRCRTSNIRRPGRAGALNLWQALPRKKCGFNLRRNWRSFTGRQKEYRSDFGPFRSPMQFADGTLAKTPQDWSRRRTEILETWHKAMGPWPALIDNPRVETVQKTRRENITQTSRFGWESPWAAKWSMPSCSCRRQRPVSRSRRDLL